MRTRVERPRPGAAAPRQDVVARRVLKARCELDASWDDFQIHPWKVYPDFVDFTRFSQSEKWTHQWRPTAVPQGLDRLPGRLGRGRAKWPLRLGRARGVMRQGERERAREFTREWDTSPPGPRGRLPGARASDLASEQLGDSPAYESRFLAGASESSASQRAAMPRPWHVQAARGHRGVGVYY